MHWGLKILFTALALLVVQSAWSFIDGLRFLRLIKSRHNHPQADFTPPAAVVIPCKGVDAGFDENVEKFLDQDYPQYEVIFVTATADEAAYDRLRDRLEMRSRSGEAGAPARLVTAGLSDQRGEKVNNLAHAVTMVNPSTQVYIFADIDARPSTHWLRSLVSQLAKSEITVSTGFRWYLPGRGFASRLRAAWDTSIATMLGDHNHNFAWGGSLALRADDFRKLGIAEKYWRSTVSDDYGVTRAVREAQGRIAFEPRCLLASRQESSLGEFLRWSTRQITLTRVYATRVWVVGLATTTFYCATVAACCLAVAIGDVAVRARAALAIILILILVLGISKAFIRTLVAREVFPTEVSSEASCYWRLSPLVPWVMLWNFVAAGFIHRIEWRGTEYEIISPERVRVIRRLS